MVGTWGAMISGATVEVKRASRVGVGIIVGGVVTVGNGDGVNNGVGEKAKAVCVYGATADSIAAV